MTRKAKARALAKLMESNPLALSPAALSRLHAPPELRAKARAARDARPVVPGHKTIPVVSGRSGKRSGEDRRVGGSSRRRSGGDGREKGKTFEALGVGRSLVGGLGEMGVYRPTAIQQAAIPFLLEGNGRNSALLADVTGSGKTLAYTVPMMQNLKTLEEEGKVRDVSVPGRPRGLILVPSRELGDQVLGVIKSLGHSCRLSAMALTGGVPLAKHRKRISRLTRPLDLLVATPGRLGLLLESGDLGLSRVSHVVIDEADTVVDGFELPDLLRPLHLRRNSERETLPPPQMVLAAAGVTDEMASGINSFLSRYKMTTLAGDGLHSLPQGIELGFVHTGQGREENKEDALVAEVARLVAGSDEARVVVFCNTIDSARWAGHVLDDSGLLTASLHGGIRPDGRAAEYTRFLSGSADVLVTTDVGSRGLDIPHLSAVVNADFPRTPMDFVHRAGRVGRMVSDVARAASADAGRARRGRKRRGGGLVVSLIDSAKDRTLAEFISDRYDSKRPIVDLPNP